MKLVADRITLNGRTALKVWAEADDGEFLPYADKVSDMWPQATREKMVGNMVKQLDCTEEAARAAVQQLFLTVRSGGTAAEEMSTETPPETKISARLPGLVDVVAAATGKPVYLFVTENGLETADHLDTYGVRNVPPDLVHFPYLLVPESEVRGAYAQDTDAQLFADLLEWHQRASKLPSEEHYYLVDLWDLHTWLSDCFDFSPHLKFETRDSERGKTRAGQAIAWVSYRGIFTETLQESNLFRWSDSLQATLFIDVVDLWRKAEKRGSEDILLGRFIRNGPRVARTLDPQANPFEGVRYYDVYGPTVFASNKPIPEPLASRCLGIVPPEASGKYPRLTPEDALPLKARATAFRARHLLEPLPTVGKPADGRLGDIMEPLAQMAAIIGGDLPDRFPAIVEAFRSARQAARAESYEAQLVGAVQVAINNGGLVGDVIPTSKVMEAYNDGLREKAQLTERQVGVRLNNLGFPAGRARGVDGVQFRGRVIDDEQLAALKQKFGLVDDDENPA